MAYEIQNNNGLVLALLSTEDNAHLIGFDVTGYRYVDSDEAHSDCATLERLGYDVSLVEVQ